MQNTHIAEKIGPLHRAVLDVVSAMNRPQQDDLLLREAAIPLDRALFPLLVGIGRYEPIGVVELGERAGRDYTTVSRQLAKLEALGLVTRQPGQADRRVREALVTPQGRAMIDRLDAARERLGAAALADWDPQEVDALVRLMRKFAAALQQLPETAP